VCLQKGRFEGTLRKVDPVTALRFQELCSERERVKQQIEETKEKDGKELVLQQEEE